MLTVEELYLLLTRENGDPEVHGLRFGHGLTSALLTDLVVAGRIAITDGDTPCVQVLSRTLTEDLVLDFGLELVSDKDSRPLESIIRWGRLDPEIAVVESLVQAGVLRRGARRLFGFGLHRTPAADPLPKRRVRERLAAAFAGDVPPTPGDATIVAALKAMLVAPQLLHDLVDATGPDDLDRRIDALVASTPLPGAAVARAVVDMQLARSTGPRSSGPGPESTSGGVI
ncbi:MAG: GPP34 family phosphoprotein [Microbacterium sp.]